MGAQLVREVASKTSDIAGDGTTSGDGSRPKRIDREGLDNRNRRREPDLGSSAGSTRPSTLSSRNSPRSPRRSRTRTEIAQVAHGFRQLGLRRSATSSLTRWTRSAKTATITVEEAKTIETTLDVVGRHAVRQGIHLALLRHEPGQDRSQPGVRLPPHPREENLQPQGHPPRAGEGCGDWQASLRSSSRTSKAKPSRLSL